MTRAEAWFIHAATLAVGATGVVYGWMRYLAHPADEFALVNHPWQPAFQQLHVLFAPALVFACGLVWRNHVWARVRSSFSARRRTGLLLFALFVPMSISGYLLQVTSAEAWRAAWIVLHVGTSCAWLGGYAAHQLTLRDTAPGPPSRRPVGLDAGRSSRNASGRVEAREGEPGPLSYGAVRGYTGPSGESTASRSRSV